MLRKRTNNLVSYNPGLLSGACPMPTRTLNTRHCRGADAMDISESLGAIRPARIKRKPADFLLFQNDFLFASDLICGVALGYLTYSVYRFALPLAVPVQFADSALWREILLGSLIAALLLREPRLAEGRQLTRKGSLYTSLCQRGGMAVALLLAVGLATRALDDMARLWVLGWSGTYAAWVA